MARVWLSAAAYYAGLEPAYFQVPSGEAPAESFEAALGTGGEDVLMLVAELDGQRLRLFIGEVKQLRAQLIVTSLTSESRLFGTPERTFHVDHGGVQPV